ncbi:DUF3025 domain-containing protein [Paraburkholderia kururiensis]|uniref:DUF3025 domain-containing protein n=1 Tax=Paraburkholderia kururiensis TaxID=984307 RepID=A0ABZ0WEG9_9BURK|nr:DUF3025 domain-containing protein [Paraburkholderia kururiensis]WQD75725.1 DUF3025 domain-containing protein [Paraburkholderia kururiensis]
MAPTAVAGGAVETAGAVTPMDLAAIGESQKRLASADRVEPPNRGLAAGARRGGGDPGSFGQIDWSQPWFNQFVPRGVRWQRAALEGYAPFLAELNADARATGQTTGRGRPLGFIAQDDLPAGTAYEAHIAATGCVPTRYNLHDFFNALAWFSFPRIKAALNARQAEQIDALGVGPTRGGVRDALTLFDENAVIFASANLEQTTALRNFDWHTLFVACRAGWGENCEVRCFGHALLEKLMVPFKACTAHAWVVEVPAAYFSWDRPQRDAWLDTAVSEAVARDTELSGQRFAPLPVLGIPGWWAANETAGFYDDPSVFRKGRRQRQAARLA